VVACRPIAGAEKEAQRILRGNRRLLNYSSRRPHASRVNGERVRYEVKSGEPPRTRWLQAINIAIREKIIRPRPQRVERDEARPIHEGFICLAEIASRRSRGPPEQWLAYFLSEKNLNKIVRLMLAHLSGVSARGSHFSPGCYHHHGALSVEILNRVYKSNLGKWTDRYLGPDDHLHLVDAFEMPRWH
jgi:hypothetical protein